MPDYNAILYGAIQGVCDTLKGWPREEERADAMLSLNEALERLGVPRADRLTQLQMAQAVGISDKSVQRQVKRRKGEKNKYVYGDGERGRRESLIEDEKVLAKERERLETERAAFEADKAQFEAERQSEEK